MINRFVGNSHMKCLQKLGSYKVHERNIPSGLTAEYSQPTVAARAVLTTGPDFTRHRWPKPPPQRPVDVAPRCRQGKRENPQRTS